MFANITEYLKRFKSFEPDERSIKKIVVQTISECVGIQIHPHEVEFSGNRIYLRIHPVKKNEVLLHRAEIIKMINRAVGKKQFSTCT